jgi:hypothetical protein
MPRRPLPRLMSACLMVAMGSIALAQPQADINREQQVKAAYLYNFARFTTWPASKFASADEPIRFCALEGDPLLPAMAETLQGKSIDGHPAAVSPVRDASAMRACHVGYLPQRPRAQLAQELEGLSGGGVLTVHEADAAIRAGIVRLFIEDNRLRFEINVAAAERERIALSSRLLSVAQVTRD